MVQLIIVQGWNRLANAKIEDRLSRLWASKQREKEEKFAKLRKQHERELRMLAKRSKKKVENIFRGVGKDKLNAEDILKYEYASAPTKVSRDLRFKRGSFINRITRVPHLTLYADNFLKSL